MYTLKKQPEDFNVREVMDLKLSPQGQYSYYLLKKRNYTTERAVQRVSEMLHIPRKIINFAGNKDKVAVTEQYISINKDIKKEFKTDRDYEYYIYIYVCNWSIDWRFYNNQFWFSSIIRISYTIIRCVYASAFYEQRLPCSDAV